MTTQQEIDRQLNAEIKKYHDAIYDGEVPDGFMEMFKRSLMCVPPAQHGYTLDAIERIINKRVNEIKVAELAIMINMVFSTAWANLYSSVEEGIATTRKFEVLKNEFNKRGAEFEKKMMLKKTKLQQLSGITGATPFPNGKIIQS